MGDCGPTRHQGIIAPEVWEAVQVRLQNEDPRRTTTTRRGRTPGLLSGFLVCRGCGGPMRVRHKEPYARSQYTCEGRERGQAPCAEPGCSMTLADLAVLREVARLRPGRPWTPAALEEVAAHDPHAGERAGLDAQIATAKRELDAHIRVLKAAALAGPLADATVEAFRRDQQELDRRISALQAQRDALPRSTVDPIGLPEIHARLATTDLATLITSAQADGDIPALRELLAACIVSAVIVERVGGGSNGRTGWMRAAVQWTPAVALFLQHGFLLLNPPEEAPIPPPPVSGAERMRRWRAKRRAERAAQQPDVSQDLLSVTEAATELGLSVPAIHSALRRKALTPTRLPEWPHRIFIGRDELERYQRERLGKPGRKVRADAAIDADL